MEDKIEAFIAFDKEDAALLSELKNHLRPLETQGLITVWDASQIIGGTEWKQVINNHLKTASIILLLVSANFMASNEAYDLAKQAVAKNAPPKVYVVPVLLHEVDWEYSDFGTLAPLPANRQPIGSWPNRNAAYLDVVKGIRGIVATLKASSASDQPSSLISGTNSQIDKSIAYDSQGTPSQSSHTQASSLHKALLFTKKAELVNKLLACSCISNRDSRETVLGLLNEQFPGIGNALSRRTDNQADVMEIVSTCLKHVGSLYELVRIVTYFEGESSINTQQLRAFMQSNTF